jgi:hypothetical protein
LGPSAPRRGGVGDRRVHQRRQVVVAHRGRQVPLDHLELGALLGGRLDPTGLLVHLGRLGALLRLRLEHGDHLVVGELDCLAPRDLGVRDRRPHHADGARGDLVARLHRRRQIGLQTRLERLLSVRHGHIMPDGFKTNAVRTDARGMRDAAVDGDQTGSFLIDGDLPRLGTSGQAVPSPPATTIPPPPPAGAPMPGIAPPPFGAAPAPVADVTAPVLPSLPTPALPTNPIPSLAPAAAAPLADPTADLSLPTNAPSATATTPAPTAPTEPPRHPMAHLMGEKTAPTESQIRAAELRAAKKARARRNKIIAAVVFLVFAAVVGPPLVRWLVDAINEVGVTPEEPAPATTVATDGNSVPATTLPTASTPATGSFVPADTSSPGGPRRTGGDPR